MKEVSAKEILEKLSKGLPIENCLVREKVDVTTLGKQIETKVLIRNSIFNEFYSPSIHYCEDICLSDTTFLDCTFNYAYFLKGITIRECIFKKYLDFDSGVHNHGGDFVLNGNLFEGFVNFFDCWFKGEVDVRNNKFMTGTNLLGNKGQPYEARFDQFFDISKNEGPVNLDGEGGRVDNIILFNNSKDIPKST